MGNGIAIAVIAGLAVGIAFILLFSLNFFTFHDTVTGTTKSGGITVSLAGLKEQYALSEPLNFAVTAKGRGSLCDDPTAKIVNANSRKVAYDIPHVEVIYECLPDPVDIDITWTLKDIMYPYSPILIDESGHYILEVELAGVTLKKDFIIYEPLSP